MCRLTAYYGPRIVLADLVLRPQRSVIRQSFDARERLGGSGNAVYEFGALNADGFGLGWYTKEKEKAEKFSDATIHAHSKYKRRKRRSKASYDFEVEDVNESESEVEEEADELESDWSPCVFTDVGPAWNNRNLRNLAKKVSSRVVFAHVRAAGPGMSICQCASHPFEYGRYLFMHNGQIGKFSRIRRGLLSELGETAFNFAIQNSCSDSAVAFALLIDQLKHPFEPVSPSKLRSMLLKVVERICCACEKARAEDVRTRTKENDDRSELEPDQYTSLLNFVVTDGESMVATRYVHYSNSCAANLQNPPKAASLYFASGTRFEPDDGDKVSSTDSCESDKSLRYRMRRDGRREKVVIVTSEPLTETTGDWVRIPTNHILLITSEKQILMSPVIISSMSAACVSPTFKNAARNLERILDMLGDDSAESDIKRFSSFESEPTYTEDEHLSTLYPLHKLTTGHGKSVLVLGVYKGYAFSAGQRGQVCVWEMGNWTCVDSTDVPMAKVISLHIDVENGLLYIASLDNDIHILDITTPTRLKYIMKIGFDSVGHILTVLAPVKDRFYIGSQDALIRCIDIKPQGICFKKSNSKTERRGYSFGVKELETNPSNKVQAFLHCELVPTDPALDCPSICTSTNGKTERCKTGSHYGSIQALAYSPPYVCSAGADGLVKIWNCSDGTLFRELLGHRRSVLCLQVGLLTNALFSGSVDGTVRVWDLDTFACRRSLDCGRSVNCMCLVRNTNVGGSSGEGNAKALLFVGLSNGFVYAWQTGTFEKLLRLSTGSKSPVCTLAFSDSNPSAYVLCGTSNGLIVAWKTSEIMRYSRLSHVSNMHNHGITFSAERKHHIRTTKLDVSIEAMFEVLSTFISISSVSAKQSHREECWKAGKFVARQLERFGCRVKMSTCRGKSGLNSSYEGDSLPLVIGKMFANTTAGNTDVSDNSSPGSGESPAGPVVIYGHYDVVSASKGTWTASSSPWKMEGIDGYLYGRGTSDNKGPMIACIYAAKKLHDLGKLKRDVVFLFEGEEESGVGIEDRGFCQMVLDNMEWFGFEKPSDIVDNHVDTDEHYSNTITSTPCAILISNNYWIDDHRPCLTYGMRGVIDFSISVSGPATNLHAGVDGGPIQEPLEDLNTLLYTLSHEKEKIFSAGVRDLALDERERFEKVNLNVDEYAKQVGVRRLREHSPLHVLGSRWSRPSISISDVTSTNQTRGFRRIPAKCQAKVSLHFVPDQSAEEQKARLVDYLRNVFKALNSGNEMQIEIRQVSNWWLANTQTRIFDVAAESIEKVWGVKPLLVREGGSYGGITSFLERSLKAPAIHLPMGQASDNAHLPNERISLKCLVKGREVVEDFLLNI